MREVPAGGEVEAHDAIVGRENGIVNCKVGHAARVRLHVHAPLGGREMEGGLGGIERESVREGSEEERER